MMRLTPLRRLVLALGLGLGVAGCSGGTDTPTLELQVIEAGRQMIAARTAPKVERVPLTREYLDTLEDPYIEVTLERYDIFAYLKQQAVRRDDTPGQVVVWRTEDNITLAMRNGVLIATRGLGGDIVSSTVQVSGDRPGPASGGEKVHFVRALDNKELRVPLVCDLVDMGAETIEIIETRYATRRLQERCEGGGGTVVNDYWIDSRSGRVWQSRQWAGPGIGYLRIRQLTI